MKNNLIAVPFASLKKANTSKNIKKSNKTTTIYLKNCLVALFSAKKNNPNCDVALATNIEIPFKYEKFLTENGIKILHIDFDYFRFDNDYDWCLAFYKLCVLKHLGSSDYKNVCILDSDVYVRENLDSLWENCQNYVVIYDLEYYRESTNLESGTPFENDIKSFGFKENIPHIGGEFIAGDLYRINQLNETNLKIFDSLKKSQLRIKSGDEFITSISAFTNNSFIRNTGYLYIVRCWTGTFRKIPSTLSTINPPIIHVPAEKKEGMIHLFSLIYRKRTLPSFKTISKLLHLKKRSLLSFIKYTIKKIIRR